MFAWIGVALLSVSWLVGVGYYHVANWPAWAALLVTGTVCLAGFNVRLPSVRDAAAAMLLLVPACVVAAWPYRAAFLLVAGGLAMELLRAGVAAAAMRPDRPGSAGCAGGGCRVLECWRRLSVGIVAAGCILIVQAVGLEAYMAMTARSHELPGPLPWVLGAAAHALGVDSAVYGTTLAAFSMRKIHYLGATWELLVDPASWCFLLGGLALIAWRLRADGVEGARGAIQPRRGRRLAWLAAVFVLPVLLWLPFRAALLVALYLHEVLRVEYDAPLQVMKRFWSTPTHFLLLLGPVLLAWRLVPLAPHAGAPPLPDAAGPRRPGRWRRLAAAALVLAGVAAMSVGVYWDPVGDRKDGRIVIEEYHPEGDKQWERTDRPFDTTWYGHLSGYNYYCIYDYTTRYYDVVRRTERLGDVALADCDVLIIKVPTRPYTDEEIEAIEQFVADGGGLMLVGEHTNVFNSGTYLNSITRRFGFTYRHDCLFGVDKVFEEPFRLPLVPHPIVQYLPGMEFATSCSIDPGRSTGRAAMRSVGLKNLMADYHVSNYYPKPDDSPEMRYGAWVQLWTMRYGRGRIAAFSDSTIFSNFCAFEPGKKELWMGMIEWLNHRSPSIDPRIPLLIAGGLVAAAGLAVAWSWQGAWLVLLASASLGWGLSAVGVRFWNCQSMPTPEALRPYVQINMDRTVCTTRLPRNGFISLDSTDYGIFDRWILRLGYFTARKTYPEVLDGDVVVFLDPDKPVPDEYRTALRRFVERGGKILVVDSPPGARRRGPSAALRAVTGEDESPDDDSAAAGEAGANPAREPTSNQLLEPFGIQVDHASVVGGPGKQLVSSEGWPSVPIRAAVVVTGGRPFAWVDGKPVGASISVGNQGGSVTVIGYGPRFREDQMGGTGDIEPDTSSDKTLSQVFGWQYALFRGIVEGKPLGMSGGPPPGEPAK